MKKLFLSLVLLFAMVGVASASDNSGVSATVKSGVKTYLSNQGYVPTVDKDGDITFKVEGRSYFISFLNYDDGCYVDFYYLLGTEDSNRTKVLEAANTAQKSLKFVRIDLLNESLSIGVVMYVERASQFTALFTDMLEVIQTARSRVIDNYDE